LKKGACRYRKKRRNGGTGIAKGGQLENRVSSGRSQGERLCW